MPSFKVTEITVNTDNDGERALVFRLVCDTLAYSCLKLKPIDT